MLSINLCNSAGAFVNPNRILTHSYRTHGVIKTAKEHHQDKFGDKISVDQGLESIFFLSNYQSHPGYLGVDGGQLVFLNLKTSNHSTSEYFHHSFELQQLDKNSVMLIL